MIKADTKTKEDIDLAKEILLKFGCREIYIFGSLIEGNFTDNSDIDIAVVGLPKSKFFTAYGELIEKLSRSVDLIGLDYDHDFSRRLRDRKKLERVA